MEGRQASVGSRIRCRPGESFDVSQVSSTKWSARRARRGDLWRLPDYGTTIPVEVEALARLTCPRGGRTPFRFLSKEPQPQKRRL